MAAADEFARRLDLALPPELRPVVAERLARRRRANLVAGRPRLGPAVLLTVDPGSATRPRPCAWPGRAPPARLLR